MEEGAPSAPFGAIRRRGFQNENEDRSSSMLSFIHFLQVCKQNGREFFDSISHSPTIVPVPGQYDLAVFLDLGFTVF